MPRPKKGGLGNGLESMIPNYGAAIKTKKNEDKEKIVSLFLRRPLMSYKIGYSFTKLLKERRNLLRSRYLN